MKKRAFHLCYATDAGYLMPTLVSASSALAWASSKDDVVVDILDCGINDDDWQWFCDKMHKGISGHYKISRHRIDINSYAGLPSWHGSLGLYARFEIPYILKDVQWCLYVDGDTLFTADPFRLLLLVNEQYALLGQKDESSEKQRKWHDERMLPWDENGRICSGFLLMNLELFRRECFRTALFQFVRDYNDVVFPDQDALNYVCRGKIGLLPVGWGCFAYTNDEIPELSCIHYTTHKPWIRQSQGYMPITSNMDLWFDAAEKLCGIKPWTCWGKWGCWLYWWAKVKTRFFTFVFKFLNRSLGLKGRYAQGLKRQWSVERIRRFTCPSFQGDRKSICFLMPGPDVGPVGGFKVAYEYANRLARAGYDVTVAYAIFPWIENFWRNLLRHPRSRILELLRIIRTGFAHAYRAPEWFALDQSVKRIYPLYFWRGLLRRLPKGTKFVAIYYWTAICLHAMRVSDADKSYFIQGKEDWYVEDEQTLLRTYHYPMRKIVISNWLRDELRKVGEDAVVVPNGLDFEYFKRYNSIETRSAMEIAMLWHASKLKRTDDAVKALEIVRQKHSNIHVTAFGTGPCPTGLPDWFTYVQRPDRERHNAIYNNAAIFLATSEQEGWGLTPCEAMMCGAAVVCTDIGGYREFAQDGVNALMSPVGDVNSLAENVCRLIEDDELRMRLATAGYDKIQQFTWERALACFRQVLAGDGVITREGDGNED